MAGDIHQEFADQHKITKGQAKTRLFEALYGPKEPHYDNYEMRWLRSRLSREDLTYDQLSDDEREIINHFHKNGELEVDTGYRGTMWVDKPANQPLQDGFVYRPKVMMYSEKNWRFNTVVDSSLTYHQLVTPEICDVYFALGFHNGPPMIKDYPFDFFNNNPSLHVQSWYLRKDFDLRSLTDKQIAQSVYDLFKMGYDRTWRDWIEPVLHLLSHHNAFAHTLRVFGWQYPNDVEEILEHVGEINVPYQEKFLSSIKEGDIITFSIHPHIAGHARVLQPLGDELGWEIEIVSNPTFQSDLNPGTRMRLNLARAYSWDCFEILPTEEE